MSSPRGAVAPCSEIAWPQTALPGNQVETKWKPSGNQVHSHETTEADGYWCCSGGMWCGNSALHCKSPDHELLGTLNSSLYLFCIV